jgi:ubiquitin C-terminal hydrolase
MENLKLTKDRKKGFSTLENIANNCYLNSVIQCLVNNYHFSKYIKKQQNATPDNKTPDNLTGNFIKLLKTMLEKNVNIKPTRFYKSFVKCFPIYNDGGQHDARDCLFDLLHELNSSFQQKTIGLQVSSHSNRHYIGSLKEWRDYHENKKSYIIDNFYGQYIKTFKCGTCDNSYYKYEPFLTINIQAKPVSIETLINSSIEKDYLNCHCTFCNNEYVKENGICTDPDDIPDNVKNPEHSISSLFYKLPETLIVSVMCFNSNSQKINVKVLLDEKIDLYKKFMSNNETSTTYNLSSIIFHQGDLNSGHYITVVFRNGSYTLFNDEKVVKNIKINEINAIPYLIFYERENLK